MKKYEWHKFTDSLASLSERQLLAALKKEQQGRARRSYVRRIHEAYSRKRTMRERAELLASLGDAPAKS